MKKIYPHIDGWIHVKLKHGKGFQPTKVQALNYLKIKEENLEIAKYVNHKTYALLIFRKKLVEE